MVDINIAQTIAAATHALLSVSREEIAENDFLPNITLLFVLR